MTQPQWSPDRQWWWDGTQWVPAAQAPQPTPPAPETQQEAGQAPWAQPTAGSGGQPPWSQASTGTANQPPWSASPAGQTQWTQGQPAQPYSTPYGAAPPYGYAPQPSSSTDGKAIASLVLGFLWIFSIGSILAVVLGHLSRSQAKRQGREPSGLALAGVILGYLGIAGTALIVLLGVAFKDEIVSGVDAQIELQSAAEAEQRYRGVHGRYTANLSELEQYGYVNVSGEADIRVISATDTTFCLSASFFGETEYVDQTHSDPTSTPCR